MDFDQEEFDRMQSEHSAWLVLCSELKPFTGDVNNSKCDPLVRAIRLWGESLVAMRLHQEPEIVERARDEAVQLYAELS